MAKAALATAGGVYVWQDNETDIDLLGFQVHADLIRSVVTDPSVLPVTVGIFGDWGGGKSSIMKMLQKDLSEEGAYPSVACIYFNGWTFEGYEDAKSALLTSILLQLGEHKNFGAKVRDGVVKLLKKVKVMEVGKIAVKHLGVPLAAAALTGGAAAIPAAVAAFGASLAHGGKKDDSDKAEHSKDEIDWAALIDSHPDKPDVMGVRKFRQEFAALLEKTDISSLVVLIDDLDRCLPERLIETLEAIKLFVAVPHTAFVIGADPRIVRHAISTRYVKRQLQPTTGEDASAAEAEQNGLIQDYLEKLIQIPYQLPRLSPTEIETYLNLLACQKLLSADDLALILNGWKAARSENIFASCTAETIQMALGDGSSIPPTLKDQLDWSTAVSRVITDGLKGNPRQVKRMLNAMSLRRQLADVARIVIKDDVLAKLMVLEYSNLPLFQELNEWQAAEDGTPAKLSALEEFALASEVQMPIGEDGLSKWRSPSMLSWLRLRPTLSELDLREYFWLARDRTGSTLTGVTMIPPDVQAVLRLVMSANAGEQAAGSKTAASLSEKSKITLFDQLKQEMERYPDRKEASAALYRLAVNKLPMAALRLIEGATAIPPMKLLPTVPNNIAELAKTDLSIRAAADKVLTDLATNETTRAGKAAKSALKTLSGKGS